MATICLVETVTRVRTLAVRRVLTAVVVTRARLEFGEQPVTMRVVQDVKEVCVVRMTASAIADQDTTVLNVVRNALAIALEDVK